MTKRCLLVVAALGAAVLGCGTTETLPMPQQTVTFQLHNDGISAVYLFENCQIDFTITTSLDDPAHVIAREGACACACGQACPVCGPCFAGPREVLTGGTEIEYWNAVSVTTQATSTGSCERRTALPGGAYRIDVPVYPSAADATPGTSAHTASQTFELPVAHLVDVAIGASP